MEDSGIKLEEVDYETEPSTQPSGAEEIICSLQPLEKSAMGYYNSIGYEFGLSAQLFESKGDVSTEDYIIAEIYVWHKQYMKFQYYTKAKLPISDQSSLKIVSVGYRLQPGFKDNDIFNSEVNQWKISVTPFDNRNILHDIKIVGHQYGTY